MHDTSGNDPYNPDRPTDRDRRGPSPISEVTVGELAEFFGRAEAGYRPGPGYAPPQSGGDEISLRDLVDTALRGRWFILGAFVVVLALVAAYTFGQTPQYRASSYLLVHKEDTGLASVLPSGASDVFGDERTLGNELFVLRRSVALADAVARRLIALSRRPGNVSDPLSILEAEEGEGPVTVDLVADRLREEYVTATLEGADVDAIRVSAVSRSPREAALIANVVAEEFVKLTRESSRSSYSASRRFLDGQVAEQADVLAAADDALRTYMTSANSVNPEAEGAQVLAQLGELQSERDAVSVELQLKRATVASIERELNGIQPRLAQRIASGVDREIATAQERVAQIDARIEQAFLRNPQLRTASALPPDLADLQRQAGELHARIVRLSEQLLEERLATGGSGPGDQGAGVQQAVELRRRLIDERITLSALEAKRGVLDERIGAYEGQLGAIPAQTTNIAQLERDRAAAEQLHGAFLERLHGARVAEESELGYADLVQPADVPLDPLSPRKGLNLSVGAMLGLLLGFALAFVRVRLDDRIHRPDDIRNVGQTLLGTVPDMDSLVHEDFGKQETVKVEGVSIDTHLVALLNPMAAVTEAYRGLRTNIQFSRADALIETILVTSSKPGEGKSTTAANLAVVMAQAGRRVLLIDADLRRPTLHQKLGLSKSPGLADLIFEGGPFEPARFATFVDNLYVVPAGTGIPNPAELLGSRAMRELIHGFREQFDVVVFDAPPVLAATDAALLSTQCDATIVVAMAGNTRKNEMEQALEALSDVGARVIGTVLNRFSLMHAYGYRYKYSYKYGSNYSYGSEKTDPGSKENRSPTTSPTL